MSGWIEAHERELQRQRPVVWDPDFDAENATAFLYTLRGAAYNWALRDITDAKMREMARELLSERDEWADEARERLEPWEGELAKAEAELETLETEFRKLQDRYNEAVRNRRSGQSVPDAQRRDLQELKRRRAELEKASGNVRALREAAPVDPGEPDRREGILRALRELAG